MRIVRFISLAAALVLILSVSAFAAPPVITSQPQSVFFPVGTELPARVDFKLMATGDDLTYQWQSSDDNGSTWQNSSSYGAQSNSVTVYFSAPYVNGGRLFRCIVSNTEQSVISSVVSVSVGAYIMETIPQMLVWGNEIINSIFGWVVSACSCIVGTPLLLIGVSFFALGASIAILSRLLTRS